MSDGSIDTNDYVQGFQARERALDVDVQKVGCEACELDLRIACVRGVL